MESRICTIKSVRDGTLLRLSEFRPESEESEADTFTVSVISGAWRGEVRASGFMATDLGDFFHDLAINWKGWNGVRHWETLEGEFTLSATSDSLGHIRLAFSILQPWTDFELKLSGALELEAGMLEAVAKEVAATWRRTAA